MRTRDYADKTWQLRPKNERRNKLTPLTKLAERYSHPTRTTSNLSHSPLYGTKKSGFTPLSPGFGTLEKRRLHNYQKRRFYGFSAAELHQLGALAGVDGDPYDESGGWTEFESGAQADGYGGELDNPIHPLFDRGNWERRRDIPRHRGAVPIRGDEAGYWLAENDAVWKHLEPCLQLASLLITNAEYFPWWDALVYGELQPIDDSRRGLDDLNKAIFSFHQRTHAEYTKFENIQKLQSKLRVAADKIHCYLWSGYCEPDTGATIKHSATWGITGGLITSEAQEGHIHIGIAIESLQPLLTGGLNEDEKLFQQFRIASTLVHETAHAVWRYLYDNIKYTVYAEPFFEGEILPELGWSLEAHMWGGQPLDIMNGAYNAGGPGLPNMGLFKSNFFTECNQNYQRSDFTDIGYINGLPPSMPDPYFNIEYWPVPTLWFKDLFRKEKWDSMIKSFGSTGTAMGPLTFGTQFETKDPDPRNLTPLQMPASMLTSMYVPGPIMASLDDKGREAVTIENTRIAKASSIIDSMGTISGLVTADIFPSQAANMPRIDRSETYPCACPRYGEIKTYCLDNRNPLQLAFDSMDFDIPEPTMFRYIQDRGGINLSAEEFRSFLHCCNTKKELFIYEPFPGTGMITKRSTGWGLPTPFRVPRQPNPNPVMLQDFMTEIHTKRFRTNMYIVFGEFRDIDFEALRLFVNRGLKAREKISRGEIGLIINSIAERERLISSRDKKILTLGPKGIARMLWPMDEDDRNEHIRDWERKKRDRQIAAGIIIGPTLRVPSLTLSSASGSPTSSQGNVTLSQFMARPTAATPPTTAVPPKAVTAPKPGPKAITITAPPKPVVQKKPNTTTSSPPKLIVQPKTPTTQFAVPTGPPEPIVSPPPKQNSTGSSGSSDQNQTDIVGDAMQGVINTGASIAGAVAGYLGPPKAFSSFAGWLSPPRPKKATLSSLAGMLSPPLKNDEKAQAAKLKMAQEQLKEANKMKNAVSVGDGMDIDDDDEDSDGDPIITEGLTVSPK
ncbi:uncharacterized protein PAC_10670 [Phialocephala subalpina]|uniref:Uncharacterized protein n=1 Tax=Phialocephala subalpina TaxID=576137 RepID=A0A1L7X6X9_9HELO|nr:uncharacterized protein PAC_10670 [Phialocephala subalpina]